MEPTAVTKGAAERRETIRAWVQGKVRGSASVAIPELTNEAVAEFMDDDEFVTGLMQESLRPVVYELVQKELARTREGVVRLGDDLVTRSEMKRRSGVLSKKFATWMEHVAGEGHVQLMKMRREQLLLAAAERERRAEREVVIARFLRDVASTLANGQAVEEMYTVSDLERVWEEREN